MKSVEDPSLPQFRTLASCILGLPSAASSTSPLGWAPLRAQMWMLPWEGLEGYGKLVVTSKGVRVPNPEICEPDAFQGKSDFAGCD